MSFGQTTDNSNGGYVSLAPIQGYTEQNNPDLSSYLRNIFKLGIALATGLAVVMIVIGGIQYLSTDAVGEKAEGKERIKAALWGLILALASYMILNTINPALLNTDLNIQNSSAPTNLSNPSGITIGSPGYQQYLPAGCSSIEGYSAVPGLKCDGSHYQ